ncbi:sulfatase family protein [Flavobacterium gilvum]|uniref:Sulfatase n=1 Tax=Flavobacterium gilvum TaxID=1492737 RepID=A0AAC9I515_9FLAO|nr:sulfatase [Flavobacterium gilvum]AOW10564.1 sulfatase [Flavobacterium gilvum]KFC60177.1 hypothetical protein FEM08_10490 [Flavobacterium gilvum]
MKKVTYFLYIIFPMFISFVSYGQGAKKQPNIIVIISDDHAYQSIGAYGAPYKVTPNIDKLASQGMLFTNACVTNSICGPSRATFLTGKFSHVNGFKDNTSTFDSSQDSFVKQLKANGYETAWIGKWHLESEPQGFDFWQILEGQGYYYNPDFFVKGQGKKRVQGYVTDIITQVSEDWLNKRDKSKPFCLVVGHKATHRIWLPDTHVLDDYKFPLPKNFYDNYENRYAAAHQDMNIANTMRLGYDLKVQPDKDMGSENFSRMTPEQRAKVDAYYKPIEEDFFKRNLSGKELIEWKYQRYMHDYMSTAVSLDRNIGELMDYLKANGLEENTLVVYTSDQGFYLGEHGFFDKRFMYEESFKTPLIIKYPPMIKPNSKNNDIVQNVDFAPTLLDFANVTIPSDVQGDSFLSLLKKDVTKKWRDYSYYHYYEWGEHSVVPHFGVKTKQYKLIRFYKIHDAWELYDLSKDPSEMNNIYGKKGLEKTTVMLKQKLIDAIKKYGDKEAEKIVLENK